ncbi:hypothetical protein EVAR_100242_1 [Eumeta japonica]|uniref:Uncharacterized protein n=1 Tax=Eumeta variegata TaxID=151549 RepID=A0A4C1ZYR0_EUMVA|nr:hypothetical protein EVAR_100242_1 [Eumeta japonica]
MRARFVVGFSVGTDFQISFSGGATIAAAAPSGGGIDSMHRVADGEPRARGLQCSTQRELAAQGADVCRRTASVRVVSDRAYSRHFVYACFEAFESC